MTDDHRGRLDVLQAFLRAPLGVTLGSRQRFAAGRVIADEVVVAHRLVLIVRGEMDYTVEGVGRRLRAGVQFLVPAWCRRGWRAPARGSGCELVWCEFSSDPVQVPAGLFWREVREARSVAAELDRVMAALETGGRVGELRAEGELKACLARFWPEAQASGQVAPRRGVRHPEVARAVAWLERHYVEAEALEAFYRTVKLSPNHFRLLFKRETGETVQGALARLRLRRARYLVQKTSLPMKRIAAETGFADPLYFSNQYRTFWGRAASRDRRENGVA